MELAKLMELSGVMAAFTYTDKGDLTSQMIKEGNELTPEVLDLLAHTCIANIAIATMQARGWESLTGQKGFEPLQGFSLVGLDWSAVVNGNCGVVVKNRDADYEAAFAAISAFTA